MTHDRRTLLKGAGSALAGTAFLGAAADETSAKPQMDWRPAARSNYRYASRNAGDIDWIVLHTIQGSYETGINVFQNSSQDVSAHFVVGKDPGQITKMVQPSNIAWTAGNAEYNARSINIELEGYAGGDFPDSQYRNLARLVRYLCERFDIPKRGPNFRVGPCSAYNGGGIIGHVHVPNPNNCGSRGGVGGHTDPGRSFDYDRLLDMIGGVGGGGGGGGGGGVDVPRYEIEQRVTATNVVNVRSSAEIAYNVKTSQEAGELGTIANGPHHSDGYTWWWVEWEDDVGGWSVQKYLDLVEEDEQSASAAASTTAARSSPTESAPDSSAGDSASNEGAFDSATSTLERILHALYD